MGQTHKRNYIQYSIGLKKALVRLANHRYIQATDMAEAPDFKLTNEERELVKKLSDAQLKEIDAMLVSEAAFLNRKVARIVGFTMMKLPNRVLGIPDIFYAQRVKKLVKEGKLIADGNLDYMRYSEVRLPSNIK